MPFTRLRQSLIQPNGSITGSLLGTASYAITSSYAMNGGSGGGSTPVVSVASLNNQTILYNFSSSQEATITGLTLTNNNWGINVVEEWNSGSGDIYFNSCSLLCHFDSINPTGSFIDNSSNNFAITSSGDVKLSTSQYKFGGSSVLFDGNGDYLNLQNNALFAFNTGDFTVEFWMNSVSFANVADTIIIFDCRPLSTDGLYPCIYFFSGQIRYYVNSADRITGSTLNTGQWYHVALTRSGSSTKLFVDGIQVGSTYTDTNNYLCGANRPIIATRGYTLGENNYNGYMDELRITKGVARYTSNFTPQSFAFPNSATQTATKYIGLMGGLNDTNVDYGVEKLSDSSLKIKKLTDTQQPSGSFLSASVDRVYVNVLNYSNISVGSTLLGQAFTAVGSTSSYALSRSVVNPYEIVVAVDGAVQSFNNAYSVTSSTINFTENIPSGSLVDIRYLTTPNVNSASYALTASYALNGGSGGGSVSTGSIVNQTILYNVTTSQDNTITGLNLTGNKWDISVIEEWNSGSVIVDQYYNSCSLLMHFSGSNNSTVFIDDSPITKSFTVNGDSKISTAQSKFGSSSAYFDGTGDYLSTNSSNDFAFGTGDFTVECWIYSSDVSSATQRGFLQTSDTSGGLKTSYTTGILLYQGGNSSGGPLNGGLSANVAGTNIGSTTGVITTNTWYHIALVRNSGTSTLYVNGTSVGSGTTTGNCSGTYLAIGGYYNTSYLYQGYLDELRITKGVARYTGSFSVPTTEFIVSLPQYATKYIGLIGGLNDSAVDYGIEKLSDSSLKIRKMTASGQPLSGSGTLSASVDRVYVNVLNYENAVITGSISNAVTASYAQTTPSGKSIALSFILG